MKRLPFGKSIHGLSFVLAPLDESRCHQLVYGEGFRLNFPRWCGHVSVHHARSECEGFLPGHPDVDGVGAFMLVSF